MDGSGSLIILIFGIFLAVEHYQNQIDGLLKEEREQHFQARCLPA